jgi:hypothetical protein
MICSDGTAFPTSNNNAGGATDSTLACDFINSLGVSYHNGIVNAAACGYWSNDVSPDATAFPVCNSGDIMVGLESQVRSEGLSISR